MVREGAGMSHDEKGNALQSQQKGIGEVRTEDAEELMRRKLSRFRRGVEMLWAMQNKA